MISKKALSILTTAIALFFVANLNASPFPTINGHEKLDPTALMDYNSSKKMTVDLIAETHELLKSQNTKKGRKKGGFVTQENKDQGMMLLKKYGDVRLEIEALQGRIENRKSDPSIKPIYNACDELLKIVNDGRNKLLNAYQFTEDKDATDSIISELSKSHARLTSPQGALSLK